jgi:hypothetical protein
MPPLIIALALGGLLVVSLPASADPIRIIGGNLNFDDGDPPSFGFELAGAPFRPRRYRPHVMEDAAPRNLPPVGAYTDAWSARRHHQIQRHIAFQ